MSISANTAAETALSQSRVTWETFAGISQATSTAGTARKTSSILFIFHGVVSIASRSPTHKHARRVHAAPEERTAQVLECSAALRNGHAVSARSQRAYDSWPAALQIRSNCRRKPS